MKSLRFANGAGYLAKSIKEHELSKEHLVRSRKICFRVSLTAPITFPPVSTDWPRFCVLSRDILLPPQWFCSSFSLLVNLFQLPTIPIWKGNFTSKSFRVLSPISSWITWALSYTWYPMEAPCISGSSHDQLCLLSRGPTILFTIPFKIPGICFFFFQQKALKGIRSC